jgi:hypothetical protein
MQKRMNQQSRTGPEEPPKYTLKEIAVIVFAWLLVLSLTYICYLKFKFFYTNK